MPKTRDYLIALGYAYARNEILIESRGFSGDNVPNPVRFAEFRIVDMKGSPQRYVPTLQDSWKLFVSRTSWAED